MYLPGPAADNQYDGREQSVGVEFVLLLGAADNQLMAGVHNYLVKNYNYTIIERTPLDLVRTLQVDDKIDRFGTASLHWEISDQSVDSDQVIGVLNLVGELPITIFDNYHLDDRSYAAAEYKAYLQFALSVFPNVLNSPNDGSLSGYSRSLPYQWELLKKNRLGNVPEYFYGLLKDLPYWLGNLSELIVNPNPYSTRYWKASRQYLNDGRAKLCYPRPTGSAYLCSYVDGNILGYDTLSKEEHIPPDTLLLAVKYLTDHFKLRLATVLYFYDRSSDSWTFGSISPEIIATDFPPSLSASVVEQVSRALVRE